MFVNLVVQLDLNNSCTEILTISKNLFSDQKDDGLFETIETQ